LSETPCSVNDLLRPLTAIRFSSSTSSLFLLLWLGLGFNVFCHTTRREEERRRRRKKEKEEEEKRRRRY
jgi:hypothetical protein